MDVQELHDLEIIEYPHAMPSSLNNPLLPLMERQHWIPSMKSSRPDGRQYNVGDQEVWEAFVFFPYYF